MNFEILHNFFILGHNSPSPAAAASVPVRQKPLKGGLNQLNSNPSKTTAAPSQRKAAPTNFAQAVAPPSVNRDDHSGNLTLVQASVESLISDVEALILVTDLGNHNLHLKHLDLGYKPSPPISKYLTAKQTSLSVTLKQTKAYNNKQKYEIVRAHINDEKKALEDKFDPFFKDFKTKTQPNNKQDAAKITNGAEKVQNGGNVENQVTTDADIAEIDLDELDEYYDDLQRIIEYLERELPKVLPTIANDKSEIQKLSNKILSNPKNDEAAELQSYFDQQQISSRIKHIFIAEYLKFRSKDESDVSSSTNTPSPPPPADPELEATIKLFFTWLKHREKKNDVFFTKVDLYSTVLRKYSVLAREWMKIINGPRDNHFQSFMKKSVLGEDHFNKLKSETTIYMKDNQKLVMQDFTILTTWLESDTNSYKSMNGSYNDNFESGTLGVTLRGLEKEFYDYQQSLASKKDIIPIIRIILFLRYCEIKLEGLLKMHLRCHSTNNEDRNKEFSQKIQNLMFKWANQRVLDDVNLYLSRETFGASDDFGIKVDSYVNTVTKILCNFFADKKEKQKVDQQKKPAVVGENGDVGGKKKKNQDANSKQFNQADYLGFSHFLELSVASERVVLPPTANIESIIWTFQARNISFTRLSDIYSKSQKVGGCSWQLQISQLKLNPPLGVTVPDIAEYLGSYFASVNNSVSSTSTTVEEDVSVDNNEVVDEEEMEVVSEEDLLSMIQKSLTEQYKESEVLDFISELKKGSINVREGELISSYEEMFKSGALFSKSYWSSNDQSESSSSRTDQSESSAGAGQCALITAGIWHDLNVTSDFLSMCVRNIHDNQLPYQGVLIKWAKMLETSTVFSTSVLDIFTIIKATLLIYDEHVPEQEFLNLSTNYCLYNVEGYVSSHLTESLYAVQTQFSVVVCHLGVTYTQCCHDLTHPLPADHWKQCCLETCVPLGTKVGINSTLQNLHFRFQK